MYTISDYLNYYKDSSFDDVPLNVMDNLFFSILTYLPIEGYNGVKEFNNFFRDAVSCKNKKSSGMMAPKALELLQFVKDSKRYQEVLVSNFVNIRNEETQFGACTFRINGKTVVSFKGTDGSLIGWVENFRLGYIYPTYTQQLAINYLKDNIKRSDKVIYVSGHSKGGNLAMCSVMETSNSIYKRVRNVYNFDGPGFRKDEFTSYKYQALKKKLVNIIPSLSLVGMILNNEDYEVIKSNELASYEHYPTSWCLFGEFFVKGDISTVSLQLHDSTTIGIERLDREKLMETFEVLFKSLEKKYSADFKLTFTDLRNFYKNMKDVDPSIKEYIDTILDSMWKAIYDGHRD